MLAVLRGSGLGDVAVVVTRYFGGTLLGTGGLVRAYSDAVRLALESTPRAEKVLAHTVMVGFGYPYVERMRRLVAAHHGQVLDEDFAAEVTLTARFAVEHLACLPAGVERADRGPRAGGSGGDEYLHRQDQPLHPAERLVDGVQLGLAVDGEGDGDCQVFALPAGAHVQGSFGQGGLAGLQRGQHASGEARVVVAHSAERQPRREGQQGGGGFFGAAAGHAALTLRGCFLSQR